MPAIAHQNKILGDDIQSIHWSQAKTSVKKNLLKNTATSQIEHEVTFTVNSDGSVNVSGTASGGNGFVVLGTIELKQGVQYILSGGVSGNLRIDLRNADYSMWTNNTASQEVHTPKESFIDTFTPNNTSIVYVCARAQSGSTVSGTLYPMIRLASIADDIYEPYIKDNVELDEDKAGKTQITNPNLLDNPWFTVNQRGASSYASGVYSVDRWKTAGANASFSVNNDELTIDATSATQFGIVFEELETNFCKKMYGKTITFSIMFSDGTIISKSETVPNSAPTGSSTALCDMSSLYDYGFATAVYFQTSGNFHIQIGVSAGHSITLKAVKLEIGSISTLALDTAPNYATELLKCKRYFQRIGGTNSAFGNGWFTTASLSYIFTKLSTPMRVAPSVSMSGTVYVWSPTKQAGSSYAMSAINSSSYENNGVVILVFSTGGSETVGVNSLAQFRDTTSYLDFTADL